MSDKQVANAPPATESAAPKSEWTPEKAHKFETKANSQYFDPCQAAADRSIKCLKRNGGDRAMCADFFQAYRDCKEAWMTARREEKRGKGYGWFS